MLIFTYVFIAYACFRICFSHIFLSLMPFPAFALLYVFSTNVFLHMLYYMCFQQIFSCIRLIICVFNKCFSCICLIICVLNKCFSAYAFIICVFNKCFSCICLIICVLNKCFSAYAFIICVFNKCFSAYDFIDYAFYS
jgi:hypothetical protein